MPANDDVIDTSHLPPFKVAHAVAEDWAHVAQGCADHLAPVTGEEANLGFLYVTDTLAEHLGSILTYLRQRTGIEHWVGTVGIGVLANDAQYVDQPAAVAMTAPLPENAFRVFPSIGHGIDELVPECRAWMESVTPLVGIVHGDPENESTPALVSDLATYTASFLVGGLTSSRGAHHQLAGRVTGGGLSGVLFSSEVAVQTALTQGCVPIGTSHIVSDCVDNVVIGLDGRRALDVFREDIGPPMADNLDLVAGRVHAALPLPGSDTGDYMVRNLVAIDPMHGWMAIAGDIDAGDRLLFVRQDAASARENMDAMLSNLKRRVTRPPRGGVYFSCVARAPGMAGGLENELSLICGALGSFPIIGVYCNGEISNGRLYGYTGVLALFTG